jgi:hypothetical protein
MGLYTWAEWSHASSRQVLQVLGQLAGALEATHAAGAVHRDVKGGNIRVSLEGARAVLMDFGAGTYAGAAPLTKGALPPGTEEYRSPEALDYAHRRPRQATQTYAAQPADDVFALGVCAYRLVTGWYLPPLEMRPEGDGVWRLEFRVPRPPVEMNLRVEPLLSELILRMLEREPRRRPSAGELAQVLEEAVHKAGAGADRPLFQREEPAVPAEGAAPARRKERTLESGGERAGRVSARARRRRWAEYAACALLGAMASVTAVRWGQRSEQGDSAVVAQPSPSEEPVGLGDTRLKAPAPRTKDAPSALHPSRPVPDKPLEDQRRAPHCLAPVEVTIHGGCWIAVPPIKPPCGDAFYEWQGGCYMPSTIRPRQPTSEPQ